MVLLVLVGGVQILGFSFTLARLAYDEWKQWRLSRATREEGLHNDAECPTWKAATT
jgi:hypothetical protein